MIAANSDRSFDGIGMSVPGRFGLQLKESNLGKFHLRAQHQLAIGQIKSRVEEATGLPVVVDNVANACALSEVWFGESDGMHDLVMVSCRKELALASLPTAGSSAEKEALRVSSVMCSSTRMDCRAPVEAEDAGKP